MVASTSSPRASAAPARGRDVGDVAGALVALTCQIPHEPRQQGAGAYPAQSTDPRPIGSHASCSRQAAATSKCATFPWSVWWVSRVQKSSHPPPISAAQPRYPTVVTWLEHGKVGDEENARPPEPPKRSQTDAAGPDDRHR